MNPADASKPREICQNEPQIAARLAKTRGKLRALAAAGRPPFASQMLWRTARRLDSVTPALSLRYCPPGIRSGEDVVDIVVDEHDLERMAVDAVMLRQIGISFSLNAFGRLSLAQKHEVVELRRIIAFSLWRHSNGNLG